MLAQNF
jgi:hypothetical protein